MNDFVIWRYWNVTQGWFKAIICKQHSSRCIWWCQGRLLLRRRVQPKEIPQVIDLCVGFFFLRLFLKLVWWYFALNLLNAEAVKELYDKMLDSVVVKRSMPPNAWLWSLLENCKNHDDIKLLFDILEKLRRFVSFCCFLIITPFIIFNLTCKVLFLGKLDTLSKGLEPMISSSILFLWVGPWGTFHLSYSLLPVWSIELEWLIADRSTLLAAETFKSSYSWEF